MTVDELPHVLHSFLTLEGRGLRVLNVTTDLAINPDSPGFDAGKLHDFAKRVSSLSANAGNDLVQLHSAR